MSLLPTTLAEYEAALPELGRERVLQIFREVETAKEVKLGLCREFRQQLIWEEDGETLLAACLNGSDTGCPKSQTSFCFLRFSQTKFIQNANVGGVLKNSGNLLHDRHKNFENRFRNS